MKKVILFIAATAVSIVMVNAQSDTTKTKQPTTPQTQSTNYQNYPTKDMKKVATADIPASLRTTLQGSEYKGWESNTLYFNSTTNEYSYKVAPAKGSGTSVKDKNATSWYRFDQSGQRIPDMNPKN